MIYPENFPEHNTNHGERKVFSALKELDPYDFDVFWNRTFAGKTKDEGELYEIDFLIFDLRDECLNNIYVIEVKGGNMKFSAEDNSWFQSGREMEKAPDLQAMQYVSNIIERYKNTIQYKVPVTWLLWFPDGIIDKSILPTQFKEWGVLDQMDLEMPKKALDAVRAEREDHFSSFKGISISTYEGEIKSDLTKSLGVSVNVKSLLEDMKISLDLAESHQKIFFTGLLEIPRLAVEGCAGSGKTVLAKCGAEILNESGKKVLFLCYNRVLRTQVKNQLSSNIDVNTILHFMVTYIDVKEPDWFKAQDEKDGMLYETYIPEKFREVLKNYKIDPAFQYDAIFIDEAQDMHISWLNTMLKLLLPKGKYLLFYDHRQNIFDQNFNLPISEHWTHIKLQHNYRNTKEINKFINEIVKTDFISGLVPEGEKVKVRDYNPEEPGKALHRTLIELNHIGKVPLEKVKIITDGSASHWNLEELSDPAGYNYLLLDPEQALDKDKIYYTSIHRYKGCESEVVILLLKKPLSEIEDMNTLYTQLSRAKSLLYVLEPEKN